MTTDLKIIVALYIRGDDLDPNTVTSELNVAPSRLQRKGERKITSSNREYIVKTGMWGLIANSDTNLLCDHIASLTSGITLDADAIFRLPGVEEAFIDVFVAAIGEEDGEGSCEFELTKDNVAALEQLRLPVRFSVSIGKD